MNDLSFFRVDVFPKNSLRIQETKAATRVSDDQKRLESKDCVQVGRCLSRGVVGRAVRSNGGEGSIVPFVASLAPLIVVLARRVRFSCCMVGGLSAFGRASGIRFVVVEGMATSLLLDG